MLGARLPLRARKRTPTHETRTRGRAHARTRARARNRSRIPEIGMRANARSLSAPRAYPNTRRAHTRTRARAHARAHAQIEKIGGAARGPKALFERERERERDAEGRQGLGQGNWDSSPEEWVFWHFFSPSLFFNRYKGDTKNLKTKLSLS